jgi:hypothetical protein
LKPVGNEKQEFELAGKVPSLSAGVIRPLCRCPNGKGIFQGTTVLGRLCPLENFFCQEVPAETKSNPRALTCLKMHATLRSF